MTIHELLKSYETALNANDLETILALYGSEPIFMPQHAPAWWAETRFVPATRTCSTPSS